MEGTKKAAGEAAGKGVYVKVDADTSIFIEALRRAIGLVKKNLHQKNC